MDTQHEMTRRDGSQQTAERTRQRPAVTPAVDIYESADEILVMADLPGVEREHVAIDLEKGQLTLTAQRDASPSSGGAIATEFGSGDFYRSFLVPQGIDADRISAELTHGVLRLRLPKSPALKPRRIEVKSA